jgi:hypothetical protein
VVVLRQGTKDEGRETEEIRRSCLTVFLTTFTPGSYIHYLLCKSPAPRAARAAPER